MKQRRSATSLVEVIIALSIASMVIVPISLVFNTSNRQTTRGHNFTFASSLARRVLQHVQQLPFKDVLDVPLPGVLIGEDPSDQFFGAFLNLGTTHRSVKHLTQNDMPDLYEFIKKHGFRYSISVGTVSFSAEDNIKSVTVYITWKEMGKDYMYKSHAFIASY